MSTAIATDIATATDVATATDTATDTDARTRVVPFYPTGSTFLVSVEVLLWTLLTVGFIMVMVVVMMQ